MPDIWEKNFLFNKRNIQGNKAFHFQYMRRFCTSPRFQVKGHEEDAPPVCRLVHARHWNTPRSCGCSDFKAGCKFWENLLVRGKLVIPREKSPPAMSIIQGTILRDNSSGVEQSLQEGLNGMTKVRDWSVTFLLLRLPMIHGW